MDVFYEVIWWNINILNASKKFHTSCVMLDLCGRYYSMLRLFQLLKTGGRCFRPLPLPGVGNALGH